MFFPWSRSSRNRQAEVKRRPERRKRVPLRERLRVEALEDRTVMSTNFPLSLTDWTAMGPAPILNGMTPGNMPCSGRITALVAHPTDANIIYVASSGGGVWKTTNGGVTWAPLTDGEQTLMMGSIYLAPSNPNIVYAATGDPLVNYGRGILKSTNGGNTWTQLAPSFFDRRCFSKIIVDPTNPNIVYAAMDNSGYNGVDLITGVFKSTDGGQSWFNTFGGLAPTAGFSDLVMHPTNPNILYTAIGQVNGTLANGIYVTFDGGLNWFRRDGAPFGIATGKIKLAISPSNGNVLYSAIAGSGASGSTAFGTLFRFIRSGDGGFTWTDLTPTMPNYMFNRGWYSSAVGVDPTNENIVYAAGSFDNRTTQRNGFLKSSNGGTVWNDISVDANGDGPHVDQHQITFDKNGKLLTVNDGGIWRLENPTIGSLDWSSLNTNLQITQFLNTTIDPTDPNIAYGGTQGNGTLKFTDSLGWTRIRNGEGFVRLDSDNPLTVYSAHSAEDGTLGGIWGVNFFERSDNGGGSWAPKTTGFNLADIANFYIPYEIDPTTPSRLLLGSDRVYETTNNGDSWTALSAPNTNGWTTNETIDAIGIAPNDPNTIYASAGGNVYVTFNHGATWTQRNPVGAPSVNLDFADFVVDPNNKNIVYVVASRFEEFTGGPHVWRSTNGGANWTNVSGNLPALPHWTIALDTRGSTTSDDILYVGNDTGVFRSFNGGGTWTRFGDGMPNVQVHDLELNQQLNILSAGTYGRGMWQISLVGISINDVIVTEGDAGTINATFTVTLSDPSDFPVTVHWATRNGTATDPDDYNGQFGDLTFTAGDTSETITIQVEGDLIDELNEDFFVDLSLPVGASLEDATGKCTINDNDPGPLVKFDASSDTDDEGVTNVSVDVSLSVISGKIVTVQYVLGAGSATAGQDFNFTSGTLTFNPGDLTKTISFTIIDDSRDEPDENIVINLQGPSNATLGVPAIFGYTITDNDAEPTAQFQSAVAGSSEGSGVGSIFVVLSSASGFTVTVTFAVMGGTATGGGIDYTLANGVLTFNPGDTSKSIIVPLVNDKFDEPDETILVELTGATNATLGGTVNNTFTIQDDDEPPKVSFTSTSSSGKEDITPAQVFVKLNVASGETVTVDYTITGGDAVNGSDYNLVNGTVTFNPGETSKPIDIAIVDDLFDELSETIKLTLSNAANAILGAASHTRTIVDNDAPPTVEFVAAASNGSEGTSPALIDVILSAASGKTVKVKYSIKRGGTATKEVDFTLASGTLIFNPGETMKQISLNVINDADVELDETVFIKLSLPKKAKLGVNKLHTYTIMNDD